MRKVVKIPLMMKNNFPARTIEEVKENFDLEKVIGFFLSGELGNWLELRYYVEELQAVQELSADDLYLAQKLCNIFGVEQVEDVELDIAKIQKKNERLRKLKQYTDDEEILANVDYVVFNQDELEEMYNRNADKIYLCAGQFKIPKDKMKIDYTEVANAQIQYDITIENLSLPSELADLIEYEYLELSDYIVWRVYDSDKESDLYKNYFKNRQKKDDMSGEYYVWNFKKDEYFSYSLPHNMHTQRIPYGNKIVYAYRDYTSSASSINVFDIETKSVHILWKDKVNIKYYSLSNIGNNQIYFVDEYGRKILLNLVSGKQREVSETIDCFIEDKGISWNDRKLSFIDVITGDKEEIMERAPGSYSSWVHENEFFMRTRDSIIGIKEDKSIVKYCDNPYIYYDYAHNVRQGYSAKYKIYYQESHDFLEKLCVFDNENKVLRYFEPESFYISDMECYVINKYLYFKGKYKKYRINLSEDWNPILINDNLN